MNTLYELTAEYQQLLDMARDPDVDEKALSDTMEAIGGEIEDKADSYARVMKELESNSDGIKKEIERLAARQRLIDGNIRRMKNNLQCAMEFTGKRKFKTRNFSFGIQKNRVSLKIDDEGKIPESFLIPQAPKIDNAAITQALKEGAIYDFAHLEQSESLRIR